MSNSGGSVVAALHFLFWVRAAAGWARSFVLSRGALGPVMKLASSAPSTSASSSPQLSENFCLICNGEEVPCRLNSEQLLKSLPRGPYTTARTHMHKFVFEFEFHNSRIAESTQLMVQAGSLLKPREYEKLIDPQRLRHEYLSNIREAVRRYQKHNDKEGEMKLTTLLNVDEHADHKLYVHVQALGKRPEHPVKVQVMGAPRENAHAKDSGWVTSRQSLWDERKDEVHEVILCNEEGKLFEGLSSNFFVLKKDQDGTPVLITARDGVLLGTVRSLALKMCGSLGIKVVEEAPTLQVILPDQSVMTPASTTITNQLLDLLLQHVLESSTEL
ncbi:hypothetical protein GUITHDRAFT_161095 [Guillardia theta CCMP2712]|uniref:Uncharacterized protein n=1 Tax=Guillardia theta (strain CCMP2712) TaxID=905079 RepID=L1JXD4_GUITC|nr:hypothetical protein GUITHDRAFT_161095 [Guillardia theta CCMP2712]EKX52855.1 hypothetical protein GUITHDRAFT_161095 [Guillardia theta CCMP2712]|eukprot:XP_005839835.1 hypothetical protein GUITHDRAFT_161095 [Guillardia theta CCMP2712]